MKSTNYFFGYAFDALLTLTSAFENLKECPTDFHLDSIWRQSCWRDELLRRIQTMDIEGVTGRIRFNRGDRIGEIVVEQILGEKILLQRPKKSSNDSFVFSAFKRFDFISRNR